VFRHVFEEVGRDAAPRTSANRRTSEKSRKVNPENSTKPAERRTARRGGGEGEQGGGGEGDNVVG
jgi:hypothetical protein